LKNTNRKKENMKHKKFLICSGMAGLTLISSVASVATVTTLELKKLQRFLKLIVVSKEV